MSDMILSAESECSDEERRELKEKVTGRQPFFVRELADVHLLEGSACSLCTTVVGLPMPKIKWEKADGTVIEMDYGSYSTDKWQFIRNGDLCELRKERITVEDAGQYYCIAENQFGTAHSSAYLSIGGMIFYLQRRKTTLIDITIHKFYPPL